MEKNFRAHSDISRGQLMDIVEGLKDYLPKMKSTGYILILFDRQKDYYATIYEEQAQVYIDSRLSILKEIHINDLSNSLKLKYRNSFNSSCRCECKFDIMIILLFTFKESTRLNMTLCFSL
jgi:hypothetical protein